MDTTEARTRMLDLAERGLEILSEFSSGAITVHTAGIQFRELVDGARGVLSDAGYPAETAWRALQGAQLGFGAHVERPDAAYWQDVAAELQTGRDVLASLVLSPTARDVDFRVIG